MSIGPRVWGTGPDQETFKPNMTFHLVPGIAIPGQIQIAISETVRVTETGCEVLTKVPQEILVR
jgi:Xaa-Pro aminopeptidase